MLRWFDTHAHLDDPLLEAERDSLLAWLASRGSRAWVVPGVRGASGMVPGPWPGATWVGRAIGYHPWFPADEHALATLEQDLGQRGWVALGECGLDRGHRYPDDLLVLARQFELARTHDLPLMLHVVQAHGPVFELLDRLRPPPGVIHAFTGDPALAREYTRRGFMLGVGRTIGRSERLKAAIRSTGLGHIVLESDAPVRSVDAPACGLDLEPTARVVAALCDTDLETVAARTWDNGCRLYRLPSSFLEISPP